MKFVCWCFIAVLSFLNVSAQDDNEDRRCRDNFTWCTSQVNYCNLPSISRMCKATCGVCRQIPQECFSFGCESGCIENDDEITCTCPNGFRLNNDRRTCSDIDECAGANPCTNPLTPLCQNVDGSFACLPCSGIPTYSKYYESEMCCRKASNISSCGQNSETRTVAPSGANLRLGRWPWTTLINVNGRKCSGVLISINWIIASAHCFSGISVTTNSISVQVGIRSTNPSASNSFSRRINVSQVIIHENYNFPNNDIALIRLSESTSDSWAVRPICLPNGEIPEARKRCFMSGFASFFNDRAVEEYLVSSGVTLQQSSQCRNNLGRIGRNADYNNVLCGQYDAANQAFCPGETGGPVVCQRCDSCDWYVAGVMTFGEMCLRPGQSEFAGYTSIESYESWIAQRTGLNIRTDGTCVSNRVAWRPWGQFSSCSRTCGGGRHTRRRQCRNGIPGSAGCEGSATDEQECNTQQCPGWSAWTSWTQCSATCGAGTRDRSRFCLRGSAGQQGCREGPNSERAVCNAGPCSRWGEWTQWSGCPQTCEQNVEEFRLRSCINGVIGDEGCEGTNYGARSCNLNACARWSSWSTWSSCSKTCGGRGETISTRQCLNGGVCEGESTRRRGCLSPSCPRIFNSWSACSVTCGTGVQRRTRICPDDQDDCAETTETRDCQLSSCAPVIRLTSWSECSASCGSAHQVRSRIECVEVNQCTTTEERRQCSVPACLGQWTLWSEFGECDVTCGSGISVRVRECRNGENCPGQNVESRECNRDPCATNSSCLGDQRGWCSRASTFCNRSSTVTRLCQETCGVCRLQNAQ